jgi:hypothetical protein
MATTQEQYQAYGKALTAATRTYTAALSAAWKKSQDDMHPVTAAHKDGTQKAHEDWRAVNLKLDADYAAAHGALQKVLLDAQLAAAKTYQDAMAAAQQLLR